MTSRQSGIIHLSPLTETPADNVGDGGLNKLLEVLAEIGLEATDQVRRQGELGVVAS